MAAIIYQYPMVSVQGGICPDGGICKEGSLSKGVSVHRGLCLGGLCLEGREASVQRGSPYPTREQTIVSENIAFPCGR